MIWSWFSPEKMCHRLLGKNRCNRQDLRSRLNRCLGEISNVSLDSISADDQQTIIFYADQTLLHKFNYLGSGWTSVHPLAWDTDFISGHRWENGKFYTDYKCVNPLGGFDIKVVWELSRCHHLLWLAQAYSLTHDRKYSREIVEQINHWIDNNPLMFSINWTCSMDVAIRAVNWMYAIGIIIDSGDIDDCFSQKVYQSLFEHLFFIINNLEKNIPNSGNHYLSDLVGLLFVGAMFPGNFFARRCFNFAFKEFKREASVEISDDGTNYEHSISYHRLVAELFIYSYALLRRLRQPLPSDLGSQLESMIYYIASYTKQSGLAPLIGDNDNGRLLPFVPRDFRKHGYMCSIGAVLFGKDYLGGNTVNAESLYASCDVPDLPAHIEVLKVKSSLIYPLNGLFIWRDRGIELFVTNSPFSLKRCLSKGERGGTHTHPDALSFDLSFDGQDFIVDPGTYVYTSDPILRNRLRASENHSTVVIDSLNQTKFDENNVFVQTNYASDHTLTTGSERNTIIGSYKFDDDNVSYHHTRIFELEPTRIIIKDIIECAGDHKVMLNFSVAPDIKPYSDAKVAILESQSAQMSLSVTENSKPLTAEIIDAHYSPAYGILQHSKSLRYHHSMHDHITIITNIEWKKK